MSRDRYAQLKAERDRKRALEVSERQSGNRQHSRFGFSDDAVMLESPQAGSPAVSPHQRLPTLDAGVVSPTAAKLKTQMHFFRRVDELAQLLQGYKTSVNQLAVLHNRLLNSAQDEHSAQEARADLEVASAGMREEAAEIKARMHEISEWPPTAGGEVERNARKMQVAGLKRKFLALIQEYREIEAQSREKSRERMIRQYRTVRPDATPEEVKQAVESDEGAQVFSNALTQSSRYRDAKTVFREVQDRRADIRKIAETLVQLNELFLDLSNMVDQQDTMIVTVEKQAVQVQKDTEKAAEYVAKGEKSARKARSKRVFCAWLSFCVLATAAGGIALYVLHRQGKI